MQTIKQGFTLVELAIVIVIIGLLIGGVLQGQELIKQAKINATTAQIGRYNTAVNNFKSKYKSLPGDINRAVAFGVHLNDQGVNTTCLARTSPDSYDGNGNQILEDYSHTVVHHSGEITNFWIHLSNAKMIAQELFRNTSLAPTHCQVFGSDRAGEAYPFDDGVGDGISAVYSNGYIHYLVGAFAGVRENDLFTSATEGASTSIAGNYITPEEAFGIDLKLDDGKPTSGTVKVITAYISNGVSGQNHGTLRVDTEDDVANCVYDSEYNLSLESDACTLSVREGSF